MELPWGGSRQIIDTGADGSLSTTQDVVAGADDRGVELVAVPTEEACRLIGGLDPDGVSAILDVT